jgi:hypothetical protein
LFDIPYNKHVLILKTTNTSQEFVVWRECQRVDAAFVHAQSLKNTPICEVPDDYVSLHTLKSLLSTGHVLARLGNADTSDLIVMAFQKCLSARNNVPDDYR